MSGKIPSKEEKKSIINCYTQRQWALVYSIILFIITAIITTFAILGLIKTEYGWKLIKLDIEEELTKIAKNHNQNIIHNEMKLCSSMRLNLMVACALYLCSWMGILNLVAELLLLYGILIRSYAYVVPWIMISAITLIMSIFTIALHLSFSSVPLVAFPVSNMSIAIGVLTFGMFLGVGYNTTLQYCKTLSRHPCQNYSSNFTTIKAYGGYTHTLKPSNITNKTQII